MKVKEIRGGGGIEIVLLGDGGAQLTGSPYIISSFQEESYHGLALGGQKSGAYYNDEVFWEVVQLDKAGTVRFDIVDSDAFESGKMLEIDFTNASKWTPEMAIITATFTDAMGVPRITSMLVTANYVGSK